MASLHSIQIGLPRTCGSPTATDWFDEPWQTGFYKEPVAGPVVVGRDQLVGDGQADLVNHGGLDKAVCVYPLASYPYWQTDLAQPDLPTGAFGENFTLADLTEADVCIGDVWAIGSAIFEVSQPRQPCWKLARRWRVKDLAVRVQQTGRTGWYFRVRQEGTVEAGQVVELHARPVPAWTIARANNVMHHQRTDVVLAHELADVPALSESWRTTLRRRGVR